MENTLSKPKPKPSRAGRKNKPLAQTPNNIRAIRTSRGLTLKELANGAGCTSQQIYYAETQGIRVSVKVFRAIAQYFDVPLDDIFNTSKKI